MKKRLGFVSNSSSSSFIIEKSKLSKKQIDQIRRHRDVVRTLKFKLLRKAEEQSDNYKRRHDDLDYHDGWQIDEDDEFIFGHVSMDNFNMYKFLGLIKVDTKEVSFYEYRTCDDIVDHHKKRIKSK